MTRETKKISTQALGPVLVLLGLLTGWAARAEPVEEEIMCPTLRHGFGPYDYRTATRQQLVMVEGAHFFPAVENLKKGALHPNHGYAVIPGAEIDYTLRAFPNHARALLALARLSDQYHSERPPGVKTRVQCYFQAAIQFRPDDSMVKVIYGIYLTKAGKIDAALAQFKKAEELGAGSPSMYYNLGLAYTSVKRYPEALEAAHKAYGQGFQLPGLRDKLKRAGAWKDLPPKPPTQVAETPATAPPQVDSGQESPQPDQPPAAAASEAPADGETGK